MTDEELAKLKQCLNEHRGALRMDWKSWIGPILGILGAVAAFTMYTFKTNAAADLEHKDLETTQLLDSQMQQQRLDIQGEAQTRILDKLDTLNENQARIGTRLRVRGIKGGDE